MKNKSAVSMTAKVIVYSALFAALGAVLGQLLAIRPIPSAKYTLDKFVLFLSGMFFGPLVGGMVGFVSDFVGGQFFGIGFNPALCPPAILYGVFGGLFRHMLAKKFTLPRIAFAYLFPVLIGSVLYQSPMLALIYNPATFRESLILNLTTRGVQFAIMWVVETILIFTLVKSKLFTRVGLWPPVKLTKAQETDEILTAQQAVDYIHSISWMGSKPGLERTQELLKIMGNPQDQLKFIHIAGTNGKGSTAAMTASILQKAGYKVGLFTSPCIFKFNERIQINGEHISDEDLTAVTAYVKPLAASLEDHPTEFELVSCIGFEYFKRKACDIVVLEVGMGGALDSTNVIQVPEVAVITNIGLDHTDFLGNTLAEIAQTKAGIFKEGGNAVLYPSDPEVEQVIREICAQRSMNLKVADFDSICLASHSLEGQVFDHGNRKGLQLPLLGNHQLHNAAVVLAIADTLIEKGWKITEEHIAEGIRDVSWPGRFDIVRRDPLFIIDGGHNPQCIEALVKNIQDYLADRRVIALTGVLADKDYADMYKPVMDFVEQFVCITPPNPRKLDADLLAHYLRQKGATATPCATIAEGVKTALSLAGDDGVVLCFGSLYSIADIRAGLEQV